MGSPTERSRAVERRRFKRHPEKSGRIGTDNESITKSLDGIGTDNESMTQPNQSGSPHRYIDPACMQPALPISVATSKCAARPLSRAVLVLVGRTAAHLDNTSDQRRNF